MSIDNFNKFRRIKLKKVSHCIKLIGTARCRHYRTLYRLLEKEQKGSEKESTNLPKVGDE